MKSESGNNINSLQLMKLEHIKESYEKLCIEEASIADRLEWSVGNRHILEARLSHLAHVVPTLQLVHTDAEKLKNTISFTHQLANAVSAKVRQLDIAKSRVSEVQKRVGDLLDLEGCADGVTTALLQEDFEKAAAHIHRFLSMDQTVLKHSADSVNKGESIEVWFERLKGAETHLRKIVNDNFNAAVKSEDLASIERFFKLFPLINQNEEGLKKFTSYLSAKIKEKSEKQLNTAKQNKIHNKRSHIIWADTITLLFEEIARTIEIHQPIIETYYKPGHLSLVVENLQEQCDIQSGDILSCMKRNRNLDAITTAVQNIERLKTTPSAGKETLATHGVPDPRDLDTLLGELTLMNARAELYLRFLKRRISADLQASIEDPEKRSKRMETFETRLSRSHLACDLTVIIGTYTILEKYYLNESFKKALAMDTVDTQSLTSSLVDDAFYIIRKSIRRAIASNSVDGVCIMLNHSVELLETQLANCFHQTLRKGFPVQGYLDLTQAYTVLQSSLQKINSSDSDAIRQTFLIALNNAETCIRNINSLHESLRESISSALKDLSSTAEAKLESCLEDLKSTMVKFASVVEFGFSQLQATAIKPKVKPWVDIFSSITHDITEDEFASYEANDPFCQQLMVQLDGLLGSFMPLLTQKNHKSLVDMIVKEVAIQLEKVLMKTSFNRLGGLQFDREVRGLTAYLSRVSEWSVREQLARLNQIATLLNLESLNEVSEYSSNTTWRLTPSEMRKTLQLRVDFKYEEIQKIQL